MTSLGFLSDESKSVTAIVIFAWPANQGDNLNNDERISFRGYENDNSIHTFKG